jgi:glycosyltransferase involved in cell wall biosynthesis
MRRGACTVCIVGPAASVDLAACVSSVLAHTGKSVPILLVDVGPDPDGADGSGVVDSGPAHDRDLLLLSRDLAAGHRAVLNLASAVLAQADVVLLDYRCVVADGWLEGLREAAYADCTVATASGMIEQEGSISIGSHGTVLEGNGAAKPFEELAAVVRASSRRLRPRLSTANTLCIYVRRSALDLVGEVASAVPGECNFSDRCIQIGLSHVVADDVLVRLLDGDLHRNLTTQAREPVGRCLSAARRAIAGLSLIVDARALGGPVTGTQVHLLELLAALVGVEGVRVRAVVPPNLSSDARDALSAISTLELACPDSGGPMPRGDVVHRPYQVWNHAELAVLRELGERLVITQQDMIGYRTPSYCRSADEWERYRSLTRHALATADRVVFFSTHAAADALAEDLLEPHRASVVRLGVDHRLGLLGQTHVRPASLARVPLRAEFLVCIGTDLRHKNRVFALRVLEQLHRRRNWDGWLVLAGPHIEPGSSAIEEARVLAAYPGLAERTIDLGVVSEAEKAWLLTNAKLVLYPTVYEGFGLVPFEAAGHGVPCMWAAGTALGEVLPDSEAAIVPWSAEETADRLLALLTDEAARERNLQAIRAAGARLRWDATAAELLEVYRAACDEPPPPAVVLQQLDPAGTLSVDGLRLLGPGGALPADLERPLLALATRPRLSAPVFGAIKAGYGLSQLLARARQAKPTARFRGHTEGPPFRQ